MLHVEKFWKFDFISLIFKYQTFLLTSHLFVDFTLCSVLAVGRIKKATKVSVSHVEKRFFFAQNVNFIVFHQLGKQAVKVRLY